MQQGHNIYQWILIMLSFCPEFWTHNKLQSCSIQSWKRVIYIA
jgi:hypothetical protein